MLMARIEVSRELLAHNERNWKDKYDYEVFLFDDAKRVIRQIENKTTSAYPNQSPSIFIKSEDSVPFDAVPEAVLAQLREMECI